MKMGCPRKQGVQKSKKVHIVLCNFCHKAKKCEVAEALLVEMRIRAASFCSFAYRRPTFLVQPLGESRLKRELECS